MRNLIAAVCAALLALSVSLPARAAALAPAPRPIESFDVGMLHVERFGSGDSVVLVPGLASGAWTWNAVIPHLAATHSVYAVTFAGFSGRPAASGDVTFARFDADLSALLTSRAIVKPALVGHSLGGTLVIAYAEAHPDRVRTVVAVDGLPIFPMLAQMTADQRSAAAKQLADSVRSQTDEQFATYESGYMASVGVTDAGLAKEIAALSARSDRATVAAWLQADLVTDLRPQLGMLAVPLTEITGYSPAEPYTQEQKAAFYRTLLTGASKADVVVIPGAKHFVMLDQPEQFAAALDHALRAVP